MSKELKAIVLTCDKYHDLTNHMILTYETNWPGNKLQFRVPWNKIKPNWLIEKYGESKIELIQTPVEFKSTIFTLIQDLNDMDWIYWCTDDSYLININSHIADLFYEWIIKVKNDRIFGASFFNGERTFDRNFHPVGVLKTHNGLILLKRSGLNYQWQHQFWRTKVLKYMFEVLDEPKKRAKEMDYMLNKNSSFWNIINEGDFYVLHNNIARYGESTSRGTDLTANCFESLNNYKLPIPANFNVGSRRIIRK